MALARQLYSPGSRIFQHDASRSREEKPLSRRREAHLAAFSSSFSESSLLSRASSGQTQLLAPRMQHRDGGHSSSLCHSAPRAPLASVSSSPHRNPLCRTTRLAPPASAPRLQGSVQTRAFRDAPSLLQFAVQPAVETQDVVAMGAAFLLALVWVRLWDELVHRGVIDSKLSRKLVHITTGLLFMLSWPLFSSHVEARFFAAAVPAANILRLGLLGLGITKNEAVVKAVSREGNPRELLRGPLFYVITTALVTIVFWRTSPIGAISLVMMCGGDGIADIVGRRWGGQKLPWNDRKSWAGSIAMFLLGSVLSIMFVYLFCQLGFYSCSWWSFTSCATIAVIALGSTVIESLPISTKLDDNFTVPVTAVLLGLALMPQ